MASVKISLFLLIVAFVNKVVLIFTKEVESQNGKSSSSFLYLPSFVTNFTRSFFSYSRKLLDTTSFRNNNKIKEENLSLANKEILNIKPSSSYNQEQTSSNRRKSLQANAWTNTPFNGTKYSAPFGPLSPEQLHFLFEENKKQLKRALKKTRWKNKDQKKLINTYKPKRDDEEDYQEKIRQLDELYYLQNPLEESEDEIHDAEIFKAVYTSIVYYRKNWANRVIHRFVKRHRVKRDEERICYNVLGCFRDEGPFDYFDMLPDSPEEINTKFLLHTKENPKREQYLSYINATSILKSNFRPTRKTKVIIHGFGSSCHRVWVREMRETLLKMEDVNVICVQWEDGASTPNYVRAASNTRLVGAQVAVFLELTARVTNMSLDDVHLIGFSLGAHVSGYAGQRLNGIGRISGLDPAGPLFESFPPNMRLDASDAKFVDVIHTNADSLLWGGLGAYDPMGHVDFYPNGGRVQKGCKNLFVGGVSDILWPRKGDGRYLCNHRRGYKYFMQSVMPVCTFPAFPCRDYETFLKGDCFPCKDCGNMGYYADKSQGRGQMFLVTRDTEPFCANQFKTEIWHSGGPPTTDSVSTQGKFDVTFVAHDGKNETIDVTTDTGKKLHAGSRTVAIIVLHVALSIISNLQVTYTSHRGWLSSGFNRWAIDKMSIMSSSGKIQSFCHRGLTMESGLTMVFPLAPGDCNPRELTLHPLPVPWPGVDYNIQNGVHIYPSPPPNHNSAVGPVYNYNVTVGPHISTHHIHPPPPPRVRPHVIQPPKGISPPPSRPSGPSTTFSVIYDLPTSHLNDTPPEIIANNGTRNPFVKPQGERKYNVTGGVGFNSSYSPMTKEEYLAWRDAPPPNLQASSYSEIVNDKGTEKLPSKVISNMQPVSIIPAPHLDKMNSVVESSHDEAKEPKLGDAVNKNNPPKKIESSNSGKPLNEEVVRDASDATERNDEIQTSFSVTKITNKADVEETNPTSVIREDAQVTDINGPNFRKYQNEDNEFDHDYYLPSLSPLGDQTDNLGNEEYEKSKESQKVSRTQVLTENYEMTRSILENADVIVNKKIANELPFNSVIDGEIPFKERARAIKFPSPIDLNPVHEGENQERDDASKSRKEKGKGNSSFPDQSKNKDDAQSRIISSHEPSREDHQNEKAELAMQSSKANIFSRPHPLRKPNNFDKGSSNPFSYEHYSFATSHSFKSHNSEGLHTLPPTVLKPPRLHTKNVYNPVNHDSQFHEPQQPRFGPHLKTQYSDFYAQHRYYPRPPVGFKSFDGAHESNGEKFSESPFVPLFDSREPIFIPSESSHSFLHPQFPHHYYPTFTPQPTKAPKRPFNPLSFLSSLTQSKDSRSKRLSKGLFFSHKEAPNSESRIHPQRIPYYVPVLPSPIGLGSVPHFRRLALSTHLRAPPPTKAHNNPHLTPVSRMDVRRSLEVNVSPLEKGKTNSNERSFRGSQKDSSELVRPTLKLTDNSPSYSPLPRAFVKATKATFIPIRISRSSRIRKKSRQVRD